MSKPFNALKNEEGSIIVLSLLVLVILSIVGFSASRTSTTEKQIIHNDAVYQQNFYLAESGATHAAQLLSNLMNKTALKKKVPTWLNAIADVDTDGDNTIDDISTWFASSGANQTANFSSITADNSVEFSVVDAGVAAGSSTALGQPQLHNYTIVGIGDRDGRGQISIQIGYRKIIYP
jgi:Tfp pilus assembly protein PilX